MALPQKLSSAFADTTPDFLSFLERTIGISALAQDPDITLRGRVDLDGFEYFRIGYHNFNLSIPRFSGELAIMPANSDVRIALPNSLSEGQQVTLRSIKSIYDPGFHALRHEPIGVGTMPRDAFRRAAMPNASDMPIRAPGEDFKLPVEYQSLAPLIRAVDECDRGVNPYNDRSFVMLTWDGRGEPPRRSQRAGGVHTDGLQGARVEPKEIGEHSYNLASSNPTIYYPSACPELASLDASRFNMYSAMNILIHQAYNGERSRDIVRPGDNEIVLFDCYTLHEAPVNMSDLPRERHFMRLTYTMRTYDRLGNSINPHLPAPFYKMRNIPANLAEPTFQDLGIK